MQLGFGIGLVALIPGHEPVAGLHERVMSREFGKTTIYQLQRKGTLMSQAAASFIATIKARLNPAAAT